MAYETGTATDHLDLYNKLYTFLTSNVDLVAANQQWERVTSVGSAPPFGAAGTPADPDAADVMLKGPGLSQSDEIFVSLRLYDDTARNVQMVYMHGHTGVEALNSTYEGHVNSSQRRGFLLHATTMQYWFVASGRRFYGVVKCGTVYESFYCGFYLPYTSPVAYPYPLMIGGTTGYSTQDIDLSTSASSHRAFPDPGDAESNSAINYTNFTSLTMLTPGGIWTQFSNCAGTTVATANDSDRRQHITFPWNMANSGNIDVTDDQNPPGRDSFLNSYTWRELNNVFLLSQKPMLGGSYMLTPITMVSSDYNGGVSQPLGVWGVMDGIFHVPGYNNNPENIVQAGGVDHLVVPNVYRTSNNSYFAMALV